MKFYVFIPTTSRRRACWQMVHKPRSVAVCSDFDGHETNEGVDGSGLAVSTIIDFQSSILMLRLAFISTTLKITI